MGTVALHALLQALQDHLLQLPIPTARYPVRLVDRRIDHLELSLDGCTFHVAVAALQVEVVP